MPDAVIEAHDPRFDACVLPNAPLLTLGEGYAWLEGPVWFADHDCLLVSDLPHDRILRVTDAGVSVFRQPSGFANGHARDRQGRLIGGRVFHTVSPGFADGMRCDTDGRVWSSAGDGVHCLDPSGALLGKILTGGVVANLAFGGRARSRLFICASHRLCAIYTNVRGAAWP